MKTPIHCPKCHEPLINTALKIKGDDVWKKICDNKLSHQFICITKPGDDDSIIVIGMTLSRNTSLKVFWDFARHQILVHKSEHHVPFPADNVLRIPWFEPNIDQYDNLIDKIKKYILLS